MIRTLMLSLLLVAGAASQLRAQESSPPVVKYGKWALLAGAIGMNLLAADAHRTADDAFAELERRCRLNAAACAVAPDGRYADPASEALYQRSLDYDGKARLWLFAGETALLGTAVMFIWEFARPDELPENIPFEPEVSVTPLGETRVGVRMTF